jgi:hypothetical protein
MEIYIFLGQLLAKIKLVGSNLKNGKLIFPNCFLGESTYQTIIIKNISNLPSIYKIEIDDNINENDDIFRNEKNEKNENNDVFSIKPMTGEIAANNFILICIRYNVSLFLLIYVC